MPASYDSLKICLTKFRVQSSLIATQDIRLELQLESEKGVFIFLERIMCEALDDHESSLDFTGRFITNIRFANDIVINTEEEEAAYVLVDHLNVTTSRFKIKTRS